MVMWCTGEKTKRRKKEATGRRIGNTWEKGGFSGIENPVSVVSDCLAKCHHALRLVICSFILAVFFNLFRLSAFIFFIVFLFSRYLSLASLFFFLSFIHVDCFFSLFHALVLWALLFRIFFSVLVFRFLFLFYCLYVRWGRRVLQLELRNREFTS